MQSRAPLVFEKMMRWHFALRVRVHAREMDGGLRSQPLANQEIASRFRNNWRCLWSRGQNTLLRKVACGIAPDAASRARNSQGWRFFLQPLAAAGQAERCSESMNAFGSYFPSSTIGGAGAQRIMTIMPARHFDRIGDGTRIPAAEYPVIEYARPFG
jgi:hypothetical protein